MHLNWTYVIWKIVDKEKKDYTKKDKSIWTNHEVTVMEGKKYPRNIRLSENVFNALEEWKEYIIPVWLSTFVYWTPAQAWFSYFWRKSEMYTIDWELVEIVA